MNDTNEIELVPGRDFRILLLTDTHFGFGPLSKKQDQMAMETIQDLVRRLAPHLLIFDGDMVFPIALRSGTSDNEKETKDFIAFADSLRVPYAVTFGNHDAEQGSKLTREGLCALYEEGHNSLFLTGPKDITGYSNYFINLTKDHRPILSLCLLDSNMYSSGGYFDKTPYDGIHEDQTDWLLSSLSEMKHQNPDLKALAFFHMPLPEYKEAYAKMKMGDNTVTYHFGSVLELNEYFGITPLPYPFFDRIREDGTILGCFAGHDHLNTISMTYKGVRLTYAMSIDCLAYPFIRHQYTQRGGTLITFHEGRGKTRWDDLVTKGGSISIVPCPAGPVVSTKVRGIRHKE